MVIGVGADILFIDRIRRASLDFNDAFIRKTYTPEERKQAMDRDDPTLYFATRFAGKEAVFKALGADGNKVRFNQIEILNDAVGKPLVTLYSGALALARQKTIDEILISLSYDNEYATAFAIAQSIE